MTGLVSKIYGDKMYGYKVALIGAGQLGSRHLQTLLKIAKPLDFKIAEVFMEHK